tara:strand:+ start:132 stop:314 length:183 start_codon:yes stop_codon:yes gene_type:complete
MGSYRKEVLMPYILSGEEREAERKLEKLKEKILNDKYKNCSHPYRKMGCCDICGKDLIGE